MIIFEPSVTYSRKEIPSFFIDKAEDTQKYIRENIDLEPGVESFGIVFLNNKNYILGHKILFKGGIKSVNYDLRIIFKECLLMNNCCTTFVVFHTHPSGDPAPSNADLRATRQIREAANIMDFIFLDHIIIGEKENDPVFLGYYSFREAGVI